MVKKNVFYSIIINGLNVGYPLISFTYVARILNPEGIGAFNFALSIVGYFLVLSNLGIPRIAPVEIAKVKDDSKLLNEKINSFFSLNVVTIALALFFYFIFIVFSGYSYEIKILLLILSVHIIANCIGVEWLMQGLLHFKELIIRDLAIKIISLAALFLFVKKTTDIFSYAIIFLISSFGAAFFNFLYLKKKYNIKFLPRRIKANINIKSLLQNVFPISLLTTLFIYIDITLLGIYSTMFEVGVYSFSMKVIRILLLFFDSVFVVLTPVFAYRLNSHSELEIKKSVEDTLSAFISIFSPAGILIFLLSPSIVLILGGEKFFNAGLILRLLLPMAFLNIISTFLGGQILYSIGRLKEIRNALIISSVYFILSGIILVKRYNALGMVACVNTTFFLLSCCYFFYVKRIVKYISFFNKEWITVYGVASIVAGLPVYTIYFWIQPKSLVYIFALSIVYIIFYVSLLFLLKERLIIPQATKWIKSQYFFNKIVCRK